MPEFKQEELTTKIISLFEAQNGNTANELKENIQQRKLIGTIVGQCGAQIAIKANTSEGLKESGEKMGVFIASLDSLTIKYAVDAFVQEIEKTENVNSFVFKSIDHNIMMDDARETWIFAASGAMGEMKNDYFKRQALIGSITGFYNVLKKDLKIDKVEQFKNILENKGIIVEEIGFQFDTINDSYKMMHDCKKLIPDEKIKVYTTEKKQKLKKQIIKKIERVEKDINKIDFVLTLLEKDFPQLPVFAQKKDAQKFRKIVEQHPFYNEKNDTGKIKIKKK
jgi:hypothetical protein